MALRLSALARLRISAASKIEQARRSNKRKQKLKLPTGDKVRGYVTRYTNRHTNSSTECESTKESMLLSLPAEPRNQVYRQALVEVDKIEVSNSTVPPEPGLLKVNKQIREEAQAIYYRNNLFHFPIVDYDATIFIGWFGSSKARAACKWETVCGGRKDWQNLRSWLKATYDGKTNGRCLTACRSQKPMVLVGVFNIVMRMKRNEVPWETVDEYLKDVHQLLTCKDRAWGWTPCEP